MSVSVQVTGLPMLGTALVKATLRATKSDPLVYLQRAFIVEFLAWFAWGTQGLWGAALLCGGGQGPPRSAHSDSARRTANSLTSPRPEGEM